eukprot:TRINITY_DN7004_c0_g1_i1.p1 TRINITY_DN7004_c0_g1~~TRINITY_DN7004_c0_g1_i1.p1  ORF type:complete len:508 (+),score=162.01 TRINITY_DN7004_c0_g1_i1:171-1694(+)
MAMSYSQAELDDEANTSHAKATWSHMDVEELRNQLETLELENVRLKYELKDAEEEVTLTQKQLERYERDQMKLDTKMQQVGQQLNTRDSGNLKAFVEANQSRVKMADETNHYMQGEVDRLKAALREEKLTRQEVTLQLEASDHEVQGYKKEVQSLKIERQSLKAIIADLEAQLDEMEEASASRTRNTQYIELIHERDTTIRELERELESQQQTENRRGNVDDAEYQRLVAQLQQFKADMAHSTQEQARMQDELDRAAMSARDRQSQSDATIADLQRQLQEKELLVQELQAQLRLSQAQQIYSQPTDLGSNMHASTERSVLVNQRSSNVQQVPVQSQLPSQQQQQPQPQQPMHQQHMQHMQSMPTLQPMQVNTGAQHLMPQMTNSNQHIVIPGMQGWNNPQNIPSSTHGSYYFPVNVQPSRLAQSTALEGQSCWLRITQEGMALLDQETWEPKVVVPLKDMRRFGKDNGVLAFECGRSAPPGQGVFYLATIHMTDIFDILGRYTNASA